MFAAPKKEKISAVLKRFARRRKHRLLTDLKIQGKNGSLEIDNVYIGEFGVLVLDSFGYEGELYGGEKEPRWALYEKKLKSPIENPIIALNEKVDAIRRIFAKEGVYKVDIKAYVLFRQKASKLRINFQSPHILRIEGFRKFLSDKSFECDRSVRIEKVAEALEKAQ
ncbi:MAG: NERD domain-containing protein [Oscillospiraceae bacterium]|jgi:hypothetical protein|nr:NERD domain-containing protein [Oscillospiraceae bacterium]